MSRMNDLTGLTFGRLRVLQRHPENNSSGNAQWTCQCSCGQVVVLIGSNLKTGQTKSCGCLTREGNHTTHGMSASTEYEIWSGMKKRCHNEADKLYTEYGARGIQVCDRWNGSFEAFFEDMGPRPSLAHSIERSDNNGPYAPDNCVWATRTEQANNRRNNVLYAHEGQTKTVAQWARHLGMSEGKLRQRLNKQGLPFHRAIEKP